MTTTRSSPEAVIAAFAPRSFGAQESAFARRVTEAARPTNPERAKAFLFAAAKLAAFCSSIGLDLDEQVVLRASVIERFSWSSCAGREATRRTLRTNLRALSYALGVEGLPRPQPLPRGRAKAPYSAAELAAYLALAETQPTALRRARARALVGLGAGAGLIGGELRRVKGTDVICCSGGVLVLVDGRRPRAIPVLVAYHGPLLRAAGFFGSRYLVSGHNPDSHNVTNPLLRSLSGGLDLPRLEPSRLRSSYLVATARLIGLRAFMDAAGVSCSQRLGDLVTHLEASDEVTAVRLLGARQR